MPPTWIRTLTLAALWLLVGWSLGAESPPGRLSLKRYGPEQGLANPVVWSMVQDPKGFMWFGTEDGVFRYDGARFQGYTMKEGLPASLVEHLQFTPDGTLWVGTYGGLAALQPGRITPIGPAQGLPSLRIQGLGSDDRGRLWVMTRDGIHVGGLKQGFHSLSDWPGGQPTALLVKGTQAWVAYLHAGGCGVRTWRNGRWADLSLRPLATDIIEALVIDLQERLWVRSPSRLWCSDGDLSLTERLPRVPSTRQKPCLYADPRRGLWVPFDDGVMRLEGGQQETWTEREGFTPKVVHAILLDQEGSLWFGGNDLFRVQGGGAFRSYGAAHGLPSEVVWSVFRDGQGRLLVGTDAGFAQLGKDRFHPVKGAEGFQTRSLDQGPDGAIYATGHAAVLRWEPATGRMDRFAQASGFAPGGRSFRLRFDREGTLWVATEGAGLMRATQLGRSCRFIREEVPGGDAFERFTDLWVDGQGRLWAAGAQGLAVREAGVWKRFTVQHGLRSNATAFVRTLSSGEVIVAYFAAPTLTRARYQGGVFTVLGSYDDVFPKDQVIYQMGEDARGNLWVGTGQGMNVLLASGHLEHFGRAEGLTSENISNMAFWADRDGQVWFGTTAGIHRFDIQSYQGLPSPPLTTILEARYGTTVLTGHHLAHRRIANRENTIELQFAAPSTIREGSVVHHVRLVGYENDWHESPSRLERYPKLPPGHYTFEVRARIAKGSFGPPARWSFEILPAWWQSWWTRIPAALALVGVMVGMVRWRLNVLHRRNQVLEEMVASRTLQLQEAVEMLRAQSMTDPLTGLRNRRYLGICMPEDTSLVLRRHTDARAGREARMALNIDIQFLMVDVDHFKAVNDEYGHHAGDQVLSQMAEILLGAIRSTDTVVRWGGEEFLVVARNTCRLDCTLLAERIRSAVEAHSFELDDGRSIHKTCSIGFALFPLVLDAPSDLGWEAVVNLADRCLYAAKGSGRNGWVGLVAGQDFVSPDTQHQCFANLEKLIATGQLTLASSRPPGTRLPWDMH